jgi:hypothetical protein
MGRDECIAWPNKSKNAQHPTRPDFNGTIRLSGGPGHYFWVALWQNKRGFNGFIYSLEPATPQNRRSTIG